MMRMIGFLGTAFVAFISFAAFGEIQQDPDDVIGAGTATFVEKDGVTYGARPDERGPIGGGAGYRAVVAPGKADLEARDLESLVAALGQAESGQVVRIPGDTVIDMTSLIYIEKLAFEVPAGVTLAGDRGIDGAEGALLTSDALDTPVMLRAQGDGVRITGLRIRGPNAKRYLDHHRRAFGKGGEGRKYYYRFPTSNGILSEHDGLEVDNCEISAFGHSGILLKGGDGHRIHHNYIHHCQYNGLGYGVCLDLADALIERNLFDWNRHSIAGTGRPGTSYTARHNVELGESLSHCFDMHGGRDRKDGTDIAGTRIVIENNTFRARQPAVAIRGVPEDRCEVFHNWILHHDGPEKAVRAGKKTRVFENLYGTKPRRKE